MGHRIPPRWKAQLAGQIGDDLVTGRPRPKKAHRHPPVAVPSEEAEQLELAAWLDSRPTPVLWAHVPNGERRHINTARRLKAMGVRRGVPDILVFTIPPRHPAARGTALELKRRNVRRASPHQQQWLIEMGAIGWCVQVCSGAAHAIEWLTSLGY